MALFARGKKKEEKAAPAAVSRAEGAPALGLAHVLRHARITEKATMHAGDGVYTFDVAPRATKREIVEAIRAAYKVVPRKVRVVTVPSKTRRSMRTGRAGVKGGGKKAYVYLKKGESITIA